MEQRRTGRRPRRHAARDPRAQLSARSFGFVCLIFSDQQSSVPVGLVALSSSTSSDQVAFVAFLPPSLSSASRLSSGAKLPANGACEPRGADQGRHVAVEHRELTPRTQRRRRRSRCRRRRCPSDEVDHASRGGEVELEVVGPRMRGADADVDVLDVAPRVQPLDRDRRADDLGRSGPAPSGIVIGTPPWSPPTPVRVGLGDRLLAAACAGTAPGGRAPRARANGREPAVHRSS